MSDSRSEFHTGFSKWFGSLASSLSLGARTKMYNLFFAEFGEAQSILDVGVTSESVAPEANFLEQFFPDKTKITAVGLEDASHLEKHYPGLRFVRVADDERLPFRDNEFDVVFSNAVIEHIVEPEKRIRFLKELTRVARSLFLTTPNKYFPVEVHTGVPLLHFLWPKLFYFLIDRGFFTRFYNSKNLKLLTECELGQLASSLGVGELKSVRTLGFKSNLILVLKK